MRENEAVRIRRRHTGRGGMALSAAFSMLELLVAALLMAAAGVAIAAVLGGGLRVWERIRTDAETPSTAALGWEQIERDLHNAIPFHGIGFQGDSVSVAFPILVRDLPPGGEAAAVSPRVGTVAYRVAKDRCALVRKTWIYPEKEPADAMAEEIIPDVERLAIEYQEEEGAAGQAPRWRDSWGETNALPARVRVTLGIRANGEPGEHQRTLSVSGF